VIEVSVHNTESGHTHTFEFETASFNDVFALIDMLCDVMNQYEEVEE
jgi:hypothetical protein